MVIGLLINCKYYIFSKHNGFLKRLLYEAKIDMTGVYQHLYLARGIAVKRVIAFVLTMVMLVLCVSGCKREDVKRDDSSGLSGDDESREQSQSTNSTGQEEEIKTTPFFVRFPCYETVEALTDAATTIFEGSITDIFFDIVNIRTGKPEKDKSNKSSLWLYTVYEVEVAGCYKGKACEKVYIGIIGGKRGYKEAEQYKLLDNTGIFNERIGIPVLSEDIPLEVGKSYLFLVDDDKTTYHQIVDLTHFALPLEENQAQNGISYKTVVDYIHNNINKYGEY